MPRIVTIRPGGTVTGNSGSNWKANGGSTFADAHLPRLADDTKSTYAYRLSGGGSADLDFEFDTYTMTANERCKRARIRVREGHTTGPGNHWMRIGSTDVIAASKLTTPSGYVSDWWTMFTGPWVNVGSSGEWTQANINALRAKLRAPDTSLTVSEVYIDLEIATKPVATIANPAEFAGKTSLTPMIGWALNDPTDTQSYFQIKVFTKATAETGGFSPSDLSHIWMTGVQSSTTGYRIPSSVLALGSDYYVFVKPWTSMGGIPGASDYEGDWSDGVAFTTYQANSLSVTAPADPVTDVDSPTVSWTWTDNNSDTMGDWKLRLFTASQYGVDGFNPATSEATYEANGGVFTWHELPPLVNGTTYRAYLWGKSRVIKVDAPVAYRQFAMSLTQPPAPLLAAVSEPIAARVELRLQTQANLFTPSLAEGTNVVTWLDGDNATATLDSFFAEYRQKLTPLSTGFASIHSPGIDIAEGFYYSATASIRRLSGTNRNAAMTLTWKSASGTTLGGDQGSFIMTNGGTPVTPVVSGRAPAGAVKVEVGLLMSAATTSDIFTLDSAMLKAGVLPVTYTFGAAPLTHVVERSDDGGATWQAVRGYPTGLSASALSDYEAPFNKDLQYRAKSIMTISGSPVSSAWSVVATTKLDVGVVWLKDPLDPTKNATVYVEGNWLPSTISNPRQVQKGLGSTLPKVIRGDGNYETFSLNLLVLGDEMKDKLEAVLAFEGVLCVQSAKRTRYVEVSGDYTSSEYLWDDLRNESQHAWKFVVPFVEVEAP